MPTTTPMSAADTHAPAANTAAVLTYAANAGSGASGGGLCHVLSGLAWSYSAAPTGGSVKIEDGAGTIVFGPLPITAAGPGFFSFAVAKKGTANTALIVTLAAGGAGISGVVSALGHWTETG